MKALLAPIAMLLVLAGCSHPLEIYGEGDILSASGDRDCLMEQHAAADPDCAQNLVATAYLETYSAVPRPGWKFHRWTPYCASDETGVCSFDIESDLVTQFVGHTAPALKAIFRPVVNTGFNSVFIGHSFFVPFADGMPFHAQAAGFDDHTQWRFFSGGASGAPLALWNNASKRATIQSMLDGGDVDVLGMTYHPDYPTLEGYRNWIDYALAQNPDTRFFIALPWAPSPGSSTASGYESFWHAYHPLVTHAMIDNLRLEYPGIDFYCIPYGQAAAELYSLYDAGSLPDVDTLVSGTGEAIFSDAFGHADAILRDLGRLVWLRAIYGVDLSTYAHDPGYITDLKAIAQGIMDSHDPVYDAP
jgi:hypothetical protein